MIYQEACLELGPHQCGRTSRHATDGYGQVHLDYYNKSGYLAGMVLLPLRGAFMLHGKALQRAWSDKHHDNGTEAPCTQSRGHSDEGISPTLCPHFRDYLAEQRTELRLRPHRLHQPQAAPERKDPVLQELFMRARCLSSSSEMRK